MLYRILSLRYLSLAWFTEQATQYFLSSFSNNYFIINTFPLIKSLETLVSLILPVNNNWTVISSFTNYQWQENHLSCGSVNFTLMGTLSKIISNFISFYTIILSMQSGNLSASLLISEQWSSSKSSFTCKLSLVFR